MVSQKKNEQITRPVLKEEPLRNVASTLKQAASHLANPESAVNVRPAKCLRQLAQRQQAFNPFVLRKAFQSSDDSGVDEEGLTQAKPLTHVQYRHAISQPS